MRKNVKRATIGVAAVIERRGKLLLLQEKANKNYEQARGKWGLPSGKTNKGENMLRALRREIREELNLDVTPTALLAVCCFDKIAQEGLGFAFKVVPNRQKADVNRNRKEIKKVKWFTLNEALNLPNRLVRRGLKEVLRSYKRGEVLAVREFHFWEDNHKCRRLR